MSDNQRLKLSTVLGSYPHTMGLKTGTIQSDKVFLDFIEVEPIHKAFAPMARHQKYDVSEMAIVTYLQAKAYNKPVVLLPVVVAARAQQGCLIYNSEFGTIKLADLPGLKVGVRAYTQTTGMWIRGILAKTYDVPIEKINWITFEGAHLEEYHDPDFVRRADPGQNMKDMLMNGELNAAIFGNDLPKLEQIKPVIDDPVKADLEWIEKHKFVPTNHVVVMREDVIQQSEGSYSAVYDLLKQGVESSEMSAAKGIKAGLEELRAPLELVIEYCERQDLLPRKLTVDEILDGPRRLLKGN